MIYVLYYILLYVYITVSGCKCMCFDSHCLLCYIAGLWMVLCLSLFVTVFPSLP